MMDRQVDDWLNAGGPHNWLCLMLTGPGAAIETPTAYILLTVAGICKFAKRQILQRVFYRKITTHLTHHNLTSSITIIFTT